MTEVFAFYMFAVITIASGVMCILGRNPVHSVLWLILAFFNAAGLMVLVGAEFIAMLLIIVYVGAVAVLFLFVVMMLDIDFSELRAGFIKNFPLGIAVAVVLLAEILLGVGALSASPMHLGTADGTSVAAPHVSNIAAIGGLLYGRYLFLFESSGLILLVAMIGAIILTHRKRTDVHTQNVSAQNARRPQDATVNMRPEVGQGVSL